MVKKQVIIWVIIHLVNKFWWLLILVIGLGVVLRCRNLAILPIDAHAMRQTDTECSIYFLATCKADLLHPRACLIRPISNEKGLFYLEFPAYEAVMAVGYRVSGFYPVVIRIINLGLYVLMSVGFYLVLKKWFSNGLAILGVLFLGITPASIFFLGHAIHPDLMTILLLIWSIYFLENKKYLWSAILLGISVATRPFILICWPIYAAILWKNKAKIKDYLMMLFFGLGIYGAWRGWIYYQKIDISWENWVLAGGEKIFNFGFVKNLVWKNVVGEVMGKVISGLSIGGLTLGIAKKEKKLMPIFGWLLMVPIYWYIAFDGNLTHQYYADVYIIPVAILAAYFSWWLWRKNKWLTIIILVEAIYNGYHTSEFYFLDLQKKENVALGVDVAKYIQEDSKILYLFRGDSVPLSLSHRQGWILGEWPTDVAAHAWAVMELKHYGIGYVVEPIVDTGGMNGDEVKVIAKNFDNIVEIKTMRIYKRKLGE